MTQSRSAPLFLKPSEPCVAYDAPIFARQLAQWFRAAQRDLPWRQSENARDAYRVAVSEVMLQQTTVAAVVPFYKRFLQRFPNVQSLADASLEDVLPFWAGLGYYSRARNLHAMARAVVEKHGGVFPRELKEIISLPGIGRYTAGAVASIAFEQRAPIVDANVARVFSRVFCLEGDLKSSANQSELWRRASEVVEQSDEAPSQINPALMELGALICTPRAPRCEACPVAQFCAARAQNRQNELPHATPKREIIELRDACVLFKSTPENGCPPRSGRADTFLRRRSHDAKIWWRGMWELPRVTAREGESTRDAAARMLRDEFGLDCAVGEKLHTLTHGVTHHRISLDCYEVECENALHVSESANWFHEDEIVHLALPSTMRALLKKIGAPKVALQTKLQPALWSE